MKTKENQCFERNVIIEIEKAAVQRLINNIGKVRVTRMNYCGSQTSVKCRVALLIWAVLAFMTTSGAASGVLMYETGTPGVGLGSAGHAARAQDASTVYYNPAGMMLLNKSEYMVGAQAMVGYFKFQPGANMDHVTGNDGTNPIGWLPSGSFYYVKDVNARTKIGFGMFSNFGIVTPELDKWSGR